MAGDKDPAEDKGGYFEHERLTTVYSSVFFLACSLLLGLPLWWHTTTVYRADLPSQRVAQLLATKPEILTRLKLRFEENFPQDVADQLSFLLEYELAIKASNPDWALVFRYELVRDDDESDLNQFFFKVSPPNSPQSGLFEAEIDAPRRKTTITLRDVNTDLEKLVGEVSNFIKQNLVLEKDLNDQFSSIVSRSQSFASDDKKRNSDALRADSSYDVLFTLINSEPANYKVQWQIQSSIRRILLPLLAKFSALAKFKPISQIIYQMRLGSDLMKTADGYVFEDKDIPHLISPIERKIGFTLSNSSVINLVTYLPPSEETPLSFIDANGRKSSMAFYSSWGALKVENLKSSPLAQVLEADNQIKSFIPVIKTLLGIRPLEESMYSGISPVDVSPLELDMLYRQRSVLYIAQAVSTVNSLITLTDQIRNMVIKDEIGQLAEQSLNLVQTSIDCLSSGSSLEDAVSSASLASLYAEKAFSDPTILAMLYFPEDQKYAIYVPMFVPMSLPLLSSVGTVMGYLKSRRNQAKPHTD